MSLFPNFAKNMVDFFTTNFQTLEKKTDKTI